MTTPLLATKTKIPPLREKRVSRPRLVERITEGLASKLTLISSPAGFGKTTLLSEFAANSPRPLSWVSLDEDDNDLIRFLSYTLAALRDVEPELSDSVIITMLETRKPEPMEKILTVLINEIAERFEPFVLIFDDYHLIGSQAVHDVLALIIEHQPEQMHVIISSRADPPLPLARLRARNQLNEIRENDLRFSRGEAGEFLNQVMALGLKDDEVLALENRTEGWIVGLQLAAISLMEQRNKRDFITSFAGSNRYILDYLGQEVLEGLDERTKSFLLSTSILEKFTAPLCEALTGFSDSQQILESLEDNHLFLIPLDRERRWYRYHHLFGDFLAKLLRQIQPDQIPALHRKASQWFEGEGYIDEAIDHALSAGDQTRAMNLIEEIAEAKLMRSELSSFMGWIERLPEEAILSRPSLSLSHAWAAMLRGDSVELIESRLEAVELGEVDDHVLGSAVALRAMLASVQEEPTSSLELSERALELLPEDSHFLRSLVADNLGMVYLLSGDFTTAIDAFAQAAEIGRKSGNIMIAVSALGNMAGIWMVQGQLKRAWRANQQSLELATDSRGRRLPVAGKVLLGMGEISREWNDFETAEAYLTEGIDLFRQYGEIGSLLAYISLAQIKVAQGKLEEAQNVVDLARQLALKFDASTMDDDLVEAFQVQLWIAQGDVKQAARWAEEKKLKSLVEGENTTSRFNISWELHCHTLARIYIAKKNYSGAFQVIEPLLEVTKEHGRVRSMMRVLILKALILAGWGRDEEALSVLQEVLNLGRDEGYVRVFLDEGEPIVHLLYEAAARRIEPEYVGQLLAAYSKTELSGARIAAQSLERTELVEPLSEREVEVLQLVAQGLSNQEIARELHISLSTVKGHTSNIFGKLGVHNRTQAASLAAELGILLND